MTTKNRRTGFGLMLAGALVLLVNLFDWNFGAALWPLFILVPGAAFLAAAYFGDKAVSGLYLPGCVLSTLGLIFLVQNAADYFESWAYVWALIPASVGAGLVLHGRKSGNDAVQDAGKRMGALFGVVFVIGLAFFEAFIFRDFTDTWLFRVALPVGLIIAGALLLTQKRSE